MSKNNSFARKCGKILAGVQSIADDVMMFGFKKMREAISEKDLFPKEPKTLPEKGKFVLKKTVQFLGQTGESFYEHYEKLKAEKVEKKEKNKL